MSGPSPASVDEVGVTPMGLTHRATEGISIGGDQDKVNMVGHQAIGPDFNSCLQRLFGQQIAINFVIAVLKEDRLSPIPALRHMVGKSGYHDPRQSSHD